MINWRDRAKRLIKGVFRYTHTVTTESVIAAPPDVDVVMDVNQNILVMDVSRTIMCVDIVREKLSMSVNNNKLSLDITYRG